MLILYVQNQVLVTLSWILRHEWYCLGIPMTLFDNKNMDYSTFFRRTNQLGQANFNPKKLLKDTARPLKMMEEMMWMFFFNVHISLRP